MTTRTTIILDNDRALNRVNFTGLESHELADRDKHDVRRLDYQEARLTLRSWGRNIRAWVTPKLGED